LILFCTKECNPLTPWPSQCAGTGGTF